MCKKAQNATTDMTSGITKIERKHSKKKRQLILGIKQNIIT